MTPVDQPAVEASDGDRVPESAKNWPRTALLFVGLVAGQLAIIWPVAIQRAFDGDEGFYAIADKLVAHGHEPYFGFWIQYPPGLAYVYAGWSRLVGESFLSLRTLSALLTVGLGLALYAHVARRFTPLLGVVATTLFITSSLVFDWYSTYKFYALSGLFLFAAYAFASRAIETAGRWQWFAAGASLGLAVDVRLYFIAVVVVFGYYAIDRDEERSARLAQIPALIAGLVAGLLPCLYFFVRDPKVFVSDVLLSQTSRSHLSLVDSVVQKLRTGELLLGEAQFLTLVIAGVVIAWLAFRHRHRVSLAVAVASLLAVVSILPTPTYDQYFSALIPFLAVAAIELWVALKDSNRTMTLVGVTIVALYVLSAAGTYDTAMNSGDRLLYPASQKAISRVIDAHTRPGETVFDFSPLDLYETHTEPVIELASDFGTGAAAYLHFTSAEATRHRLFTIAQLEAFVRTKQIRTVVIGSYDQLLFPRPWKQILTSLGYKPVAVAGDRTIYQLP